MIGLGAWSSSRDTSNLCNIIVSFIRKVATKVLEVLKGTFGGYQGYWWRNKEVQGKVEAKKVAYMT